jgi:hypothetical protein
MKIKMAVTKCLNALLNPTKLIVAALITVNAEVNAASVLFTTVSDSKYRLVFSRLTLKKPTTGLSQGL